VVRRAHLAKHGECAVCGETREHLLNVHHKKPFHLHPELELEPTNLITLCEEPHKNCHLWVGHLGHWRSWNEHVERDAKVWRERLLTRPML
jgi:5-methylcytosine-specific restriction endonuclease McrA